MFKLMWQIWNGRVCHKIFRLEELGRLISRFNEGISPNTEQGQYQSNRDYRNEQENSSNLI